MKHILLSLLFVSSAAQASWYQEYCSTADGSTRIAHGHNENEITVTQYTYAKDGTSTKASLVLADSQFDFSDTKILEETANTNCKTAWGFSTWKNVRYHKVKITKADGTAFPAGIVGLTSDGLSIQASVLCEENGNSEAFCSETKN